MSTAACGRVGTRVRERFGGRTGGYQRHYHQHWRIAIGGGAITELTLVVTPPAIGIVGGGDGACMFATGTNTAKQNATRQCGCNGNVAIDQ